MNDIERRLSELLHEVTPEPPRPVTAADIERRAGSLDRPAVPRRGRWTGPLLAAAAVVLVASVTTVLVHPRRDPGPTVGQLTGSATQAPTGSGLPTAGTTGSTAPSTSPPMVTGPSVSPTTNTPATGLPSTTRSSTTAIPCSSSGLRLSRGRTTAAAGTGFTIFYLTNTTDGICAMQGYPGVSLRDAQGRLVGEPATRSGPPGSTIDLRAGGRAYFTLGNNTVTQTGCTSPRRATQIEVYPPNQVTALRIPFITGFCTLTVTSVAE